MDFTAHYHGPLGDMTMSSDGTSLTGLWFDKQNHFVQTFDTENQHGRDLPIFAETCHWLDLYFEGKIPTFTPTLLLRGSDFRQRVWELLLTIPYGHTMSYGQIARQIARERGQAVMSAQAVGGAVGHNPVSIIVPCHRVIGADGSLTGYGGGIDRKISLLQIEGILP